MPLLIQTPYDTTVTVNAIKVVANPTDNDLNTMTLFPYKGFYNSTTKEFLAYFPIDEAILDATKYAELLVLAKNYYDANLTGDPMGIYIAQKVVMYDYLAALPEINETGYTIV